MAHFLDPNCAVPCISEWYSCSCASTSMVTQRGLVACDHSSLLSLCWHEAMHVLYCNVITYIKEITVLAQLVLVQCVGQQGLERRQNYPLAQHLIYVVVPNIFILNYDHISAVHICSSACIYISSFGLICLPVALAHAGLFYNSKHKKSLEATAWGQSIQ